MKRLAMMRSAHLTLGLLMSGLFAVSACDVIEDGPTRQQVDVGSEVAVRVDGTEIFVSDILYEARAQGLLGPAEPLDPDDPIYRQILDQLIDQRLMAMEAERLGLDLSPVAQRRLETGRERIMGNLLLETLVAEQVDEAAILKIYDEQIRLLSDGEDIRARHILVPSEAAAQALLARLADGADFSALALEYSIDQATRLEGGDLGFVDPDTLDPALARVLLSTGNSKIAGPVQTPAGWHVVQVESRRASVPPTLEELRPDIIQFLTLSEIDKTLDTLRAQARITGASRRPRGSGDPFDQAAEVPDPELNTPQTEN